MNITIRKYESGDLAALLSCWESASRLAHPFLPDEFLRGERENIKNFYLPIAETWVAEDSGVVTGFIALLGNEVGGIYVKPEFHRNGTGRALMNKARELRGELEVEVFEANNIGRRFYSGYGFKPIGKKIHDETGNVLIRLSLAANTTA